MVSYENAVELTEIILGYFGLNTGLFSKITSSIQLGKNIAAENTLTEKQKFIKKMVSSINSFLSSENVTEDVIEKLKDTLQNHFDLQELMNHYGDHGGFCKLLAETQYSKQEQDSDNSFSAYFTTLNRIVEAIFNHLDLFEVGSNASIAVLQQLCDYNEMCRLYGEKLNENNYLLNYSGSFTEYIDSAKLLPKLKTTLLLNFTAEKTNVLLFKNFWNKTKEFLYGQSPDQVESEKANLQDILQKHISIKWA